MSQISLYNFFQFISRQHGNPAGMIADASGLKPGEATVELGT
jgi:hypothetical protein